ncbi:chemotaxis protein CheB [Anaeromyxobacter diazotrophicus]|uniref:protein-glutamate methylesterase n=1 Tax=Anaeromyxobacter diazotrophicus TaxID=2590199 RepID=A0A7I9VIF0_9BACT|nr:chemotaxis protein CheB [Anaeromyxobacter diazotrophicus]GEJ56186.1 chemotaxis response regulator protein-glutamate methylesterase of group 2 operon [Anaeromyxobacter diazotrophicus]
MTSPTPAPRPPAALLRVLAVAADEAGRDRLTAALAAAPRAELAGAARSVPEGLRLALQLRPDCVCLELPPRPLEGLAFVRLLARRQPTQVLVVARAGVRKQDVFRAFEAGALDVVATPAGAAERTALEAGLRAGLATARALVAGEGARPAAAERAPEAGAPRGAAEGQARGLRVAVLGASTGGPGALVRLLTAMPPGLPLAWAVAQHMPARFTGSFAERLARATGLDAREARDGEALAEGRVLIAPGGRHLRLVRAGGPLAPVRAALEEPGPRGGPGGHGYCPSVDVLFASAAEACGQDLCAVVLTGMGDDGRRGVARVKEAGGVTLAESEASAVVYGMPRQAAETGLVDEVLPLDGIVARLRRFAREGR